MDDGKLRYQAAVETGDQHQILMSLGNTQLEYLKVFYSMMSPEME